MFLYDKFPSRLVKAVICVLLVMLTAIPYNTTDHVEAKSSMLAPATSVQAQSYNRSNAVSWAQANNYNNGQFYGNTLGRYCTTYVGRALNAGGLNTSTAWYGNQQIVQWMLNNPNDWEFKSPGSLSAGDFILYSDNPGAVSNWSYIDPYGGYSLWLHVALVIAPGRIAAWNAEYYDRAWDIYMTLPYRLGVHIRDSAPPPTSYVHQGTLTYGQTYERTPNSVEHRWKLTTSTSHAPILFDIQRRNGDLTYRIQLKNSSGQILVDTRSSVNGRGIVTWDAPYNGDYYLHIIPDLNKTGTYAIAAWANSIPMIRYDWSWQDSYSNVRRWQAPVGSSTSDFHVLFERTSGNLEINWQLKTRGGTLLNSGSSTNGRVIAPATSSGWVDFYITSVSGNGSYQVRLLQGIPNPGTPTIVAPAANERVQNQFNVLIQPGPGNGRGTPDWHIQIDDNSNFSSPVFDNSSGWSKTTSISVNIPVDGIYYVRARQGDGINRASPFTTAVRFEVKSPRPPAPNPLSPPHRARLTTSYPTFSWSVVSNAIRYRVFVFDNKTASQRTIDIRENTNGAVNYHTLAVPLSPMRYFWRVRVRVDGVWSRWSNRFTLFIDPPTLQQAVLSDSQSDTPVPVLPHVDVSQIPVPQSPNTDGSTSLPAPPNSR